MPPLNPHFEQDAQDLFPDNTSVAAFMRQYEALIRQEAATGHVLAYVAKRSCDVALAAMPYLEADNVIRQDYERAGKLDDSMPPSLAQLVTFQLAIALCAWWQDHQERVSTAGEHPHE